MGEPVLEIHDLVKSYRAPDGERTPVLSIPRLVLDAGAQVGLRGPSGSGKTTLLHVIAGIVRPDAGRVLIAGQDVHALPEAARDRFRGASIGYVFQSFHLLAGYTALENVAVAMMLGAGLDARRARTLLDRVGLADRRRHRPAQLSVGQRQRVAIARALANAPRLVLADEPTANLDPVRAGEAISLLRAVCREQNAALLVVSHDERLLGELDTVHELSELNAPTSPPSTAAPSSPADAA